MAQKPDPPHKGHVCMSPYGNIAMRYIVIRHTMVRYIAVGTLWQHSDHADLHVIAHYNDLATLL